MATLHTEFSKQAAGENTIPAIDQKIFSYISQYGDVVYDPLIAEETEWQVIYNLSELRKGILSWYDFPEGASVLEIGAGFGALTGCLCKTCVHVTATDRSLFRAQAIAQRYEHTDNLDIYAGDAVDMEFPEAFDYIILIGILERIGKGSSETESYTAYLRVLQKWLKPEGRLLIAVENRFGARYFCGEAEPHTKRAFDGINHYMWGTPGYSFSRQEIVDVAKAAGFGHHKFYYPLPDYKLPQLIYTDAYLPEKNLRERLIPYYRCHDTLVASEKNLYEDIIANNVFPFFANSFLLECGIGDALGNAGRESPEAGREGTGKENRVGGQVIYAAVSTDRGEERGYATIIRVDGTVRKTPLYAEGRANARKLYENIQDLQAHGIPVVNHKLLPGDVLELPFISWPTLSNYIKEIMRDRQEELLELIDRIYANILKSSEQVPDGENALLSNLGIKRENYDREKLYFGPILKKAYMELIPLNCFYNPQTKEFLYFDQEFVRENYPAKYVLFRAIYYIYCFTTNAERYYPKKKLLQKYDMEETWPVYLQEEQRFLTEVRNRERYQQFYRWSRIDNRQILENVKRLGKETAQ